MTEPIPLRHVVTRLRRESRRRAITVAEIEQLTPKMRRIHFISPELCDFTSDAFDDHIKIFVPPTNTTVAI